jgi:hypothetical protein
MGMKYYAKALICMVGILAFRGGAYGISADNPYYGIVDRNVFGLKSPPPPPDPEANKPPPPKITPTGITTILGNKRAIFKVQMPARPPEPAKEKSYIMTEGQKEDQIEVLEIDEKAGSIKFNDYGTVVTLTLEKDAPKPQGGPPVVPGAPPAPNPVGYTPPPPAPVAGGYSGANPVTSFGGPSGGLKTIPTRTLRLPPAGGNIPAIGSVQPQSSGPQLSAEEQMIMMEVERERIKQHVGTGALPPLPPTEITPPGSPGTTPNSPGIPPLPQ